MPNATRVAPHADDGWLYDPSHRTAAAFVTLCEAALRERPNMPAAERARYEALIEQAEAVLLLGDVLIEREWHEPVVELHTAPLARRSATNVAGDFRNETTAPAIGCGDHAHGRRKVMRLVLGTAAALAIATAGFSTPTLAQSDKCTAMINQVQSRIGNAPSGGSRSEVQRELDAAYKASKSGDRSACMRHAERASDMVRGSGSSREPDRYNDRSRNEDRYDRRGSDDRYDRRDDRYRR
jgi:hypothetical protein